MTGTMTPDEALLAKKVRLEIEKSLNQPVNFAPDERPFSQPKASRYAVGEPVPASTRGGNRTKGLPYRRCVLVKVFPSPGKGIAGALLLKHPTRNRRHIVKATPQILQVFFPVIPPFLEAALLGA